MNCGINVYSPTTTFTDYILSTNDNDARQFSLKRLMLANLLIQTDPFPPCYQFRGDSTFASESMFFSTSRTENENGFHYLKLSLEIHFIVRSVVTHYVLQWGNKFFRNLCLPPFFEI